MAEQTEMSPHKAEACAKLSPMGKRLFRFIEFDDEEEMLAEIRKHPVGLFFVEITGLLITLTVTIAVVVLALNLDFLGIDSTEGSGLLARNLIGMSGIILGVLGIIATLIVSILYTSNVVFVTNDKIAEVAYISLFNRRITQLGIGNVEDVTVSQRGILPHIFNYGSLLIETAGETTNPAFTYVPDPQNNSRVIIEAHEAYVKQYGN